MSPEEALILSCVNSIITSSPLAELPSVDWDQVYQLGSANNLIPILERTLPGESLPVDIAKTLERDSRRRRMRAAVMIDEFQRIHAELTKVDIEVIPIKGVALSQQVYPSSSLRYFDDIDLLIKSEKGQLALTTLEDLGYEIHPNAPRPDWHHLAPYVHRRRGTMVEMHIDLVRRASPGWDIEGIWERSRKERLDSVEAILLSTSDALIFNALHARHNLYNRLSYMIDSALLGIRLLSEGSSYDQIANIAEDAGAVCALDHTLTSASRLFGLEAFPTIGCGRTGVWTAGRVAGWNSVVPSRSAIHQGPLSRLMELLLMDSLYDATSMVWKLIAPPRAFVAASSGNRQASVANYASRVWQRLRQAAKQLGRVVGNNPED
jgi:hypothetical protein